MKCPKCNNDIHIVKDEQWLYSQYFEPKLNSRKYKKRPIRKTIDKHDALFHITLMCSVCDYYKTIGDDLSSEEKEILNWAEENL